MIVFGLAARWSHLVCGLGLVGIFTATLLAGRSDRPTARAWARRIASLARWLAGAVLLSGVAALGYQVAVVAGRTDAMLEPSIWLRLLGHSQFGTVWLVRQGLLVLLAALVLFSEREDSALDWTAWRLEAWALGAVAAAALAWAGHAAAVEPLAMLAALTDALHLVAAGTWLGALFPLALLLRAASRETGADARPYAVLAARRFSTIAMAAMLLIIATGLWNTWIEVGSVPGLLGTRYGGLLLGKISLLILVLGLAGVNRRRLLPALSGDGATVGRPAMARLSRFMGLELALAFLILGLTTALSLTPPARHESPWWPFSYRLSYDAVAGLPGINRRLFLGGQLAVLGLLTAIVGGLVRRWRVPTAPAVGGLLLGGSALALVLGLGIALPPLAVDAYPTTYWRSPVTYHAASVTKGLTLYTARCATCHGRNGRGDGPGGAGLPKLPANLTAPHTSQHTAGDLFWWISHGIPASGMPPFGGTLTEDERWDLINFLRALASGEQARALTSRVEPGRAWLVAPDFTFAIGPTPPRALKELRGRRVVLLALFSLPDSRGRLVQLARASSDLEFSGAEIVAIPIGGDRHIISRLGAEPPMLFPIATEGAAEIAPTYALLSWTPGSDGSLLKLEPPRHVEFLIDRQGYIRARWVLGGHGPGWDDLALLRDQIQILARQAPAAPPPDEHVH